MQKRTLAIGIIIALVALVAACKKNPAPATNPNVQHALSDSFYVRGLFDTTWVYHGDGNRDECETQNALCSQFLYDAKFTLTDSANPSPHDSIIRLWVGKTFVTSADTVSKAYTFKFTRLDSLGRTMSTEYAPNAGSQLTITSVKPNGRSIYTLDTAGHGYLTYIVRGTFNANLGRYQDTTVVRVTQGVFSINVMESTKP